MRIEEAEYIRSAIFELDLPKGAVCLNIGSSTAAFRGGSHARQWMIVMDALRRREINAMHCDIRDDEGVDFVGDIFDEQYRRTLWAQGATLLLCNNILEHVAEPQEFARCCAEVVRPGGYAIVSVPKSYPYHPDPIDTMLRLNVQELAGYFPGWHLLRGDEVESTRLLDDLIREQPRTYRILRHFALVLLPFYRPGTWLSRAHRTLWFFRRYVQTIVVLQRPS